MTLLSESRLPDVPGIPRKHPATAYPDHMQTVGITRANAATRVEAIAGTWVALRTWGGRVLRVRELLQKQGFGAFSPTSRIIRVYPSKSVAVDVPVYTSWLFATYVDPADIYDIRRTDYVSELEPIVDQVGIIKHMADLQRVMDYEDEMYADRFKPGSSVRVVRGKYAGLVGVIDKRRGKTVLQLKTPCMTDCVCITVDENEVV